MFLVHEMDFSNPWIFTGSKIFSNGINEGSDTEYFFGGSPGSCDFDFGNKRYIFVDENDKTKIYSKNVENNEEKLLYDVSDEGELRFIHNPKVNSDTGNILFMDCLYSAMHPVRLICIDFYGNVILDESAENVFNYELRWLTDKKFAVFFFSSDYEEPFVRVYDIENGLESENKLDFIVQTSQYDIAKSYPYAVLCEYVPQSDFRYRLWLYNFEECTAEELYISPTCGIIHGFDLSPSGKTLAWIENDDIKVLTEVLP